MFKTPNTHNSGTSPTRPNLKQHMAATVVSNQEQSNSPFEAPTVDCRMPVVVVCAELYRAEPVLVPEMPAYRNFGTLPLCGRFRSS